MKAKGVPLIKKPFHEDIKLSTEKMEERMGPYVKPKDAREEFHDPSEVEHEDDSRSDEEDHVRASPPWSEQHCDALLSHLVR
jgi:hypothetical protein